MATATTPRGIPFPDNSEPTFGPAQMQAAAEAVDKRLSAGVEAVDRLDPLNPVFTASGEITRLTISDPGAPYKVWAMGFLWAYCALGSVWDFRYRIDSASGQLFGPGMRVPTAAEPVSPPPYPFGPFPFGPGLTPVLTGAHDIVFCFTQISGGNLRMNNDGATQSYTALVVPA